MPNAPDPQNRQDFSFVLLRCSAKKRHMSGAQVPLPVHPQDAAFEEDAHHHRQSNPLTTILSAFLPVLSYPKHVLPYPR